MEKGCSKTDCLICKDICTDYKRLYENGACHQEVYDMLVKYYQPMFLTQNKNIKLQAICLSCWKCITDFDDFQNEMISTQTRMQEFCQNTFERYVEVTATPRKNPRDIRSYFAKSNVDSKDDDDLDQECTNIVTGDVSSKTMADETSSILPTPMRIKKLRVNIRRIETHTQLQQHHKATKKVVDIAEVYKAPQLKRTSKRIISKSSTPAQNAKSCSDGFSRVDDEHQDKHRDDSEADISVDIEDLKSKKEKWLETKRRNIDLIEKWKPQLDCPICKLLFTGWKAYAEHFAKQHSKQATYYVCCKSKFSLSTLVHHVRWHMDPNCYKCNTCEDLFKTPVNLRKHNARWHRLDIKLAPNIQLISKWRPQLNCPLCQLPLTTLTALQNHFKYQHPKQRWYYECCERKFYTHGYLVDHAAYHMDSDCFKCDICEKSFASKYNLQLHKTTIHLNGRELTLKGKEWREKTAANNRLISQCKPQLDCPICEETFKGWIGLNEHFRKKHAGKRCYCECCYLKFSKLADLADHLRLHLNPEMYKCNICEQSCSNASNLKKHTMAVHLGTTAPKVNSYLTDDLIIAKWQSSLECDICKESFANFSTLGRHFRRKHSKEKPYIICCERRLEGHSSVADHARLHLDIDAFKCKICKKYFTSRLYLQTHLKNLHLISASGKIFKRTHECRFCSKQFYCERPWKEHEAAHMNIYLYKCAICSQEFGYRSTLTNHLSKKHAENTPGLYKTMEISQKAKHDNASMNQGDSNDCQDFSASNSSKQRRTYIKDVRIVHTEQIAKWFSSLKCGICQKSYSTYRLLNQHFKKRHPRKKTHIVCCKRQIIRGLDISEHAQFHLDPHCFKCTLCDSTYATSIKLNKHMEETHFIRKEGTTIDTKYSCNVCGKVFKELEASKSHMAVHAGVFRYKCEVCSRLFRRSSGLAAHFRKEHSKKYLELKNTRGLFEAMKIPAAELNGDIQNVLNKDSNNVSSNDLTDTDTEPSQ